MSSTSVLDSPAMASSEMSSFGRAAMARASSSLRISIWVSPAGPQVRLGVEPDVLRISTASALPVARPRVRRRVLQRDAEVLAARSCW